MRSASEVQKQHEASDQHGTARPGRLERTAEASCEKRHAKVEDAERGVQRNGRAEPRHSEVGSRPRSFRNDAKERRDEIQTCSPGGERAPRDEREQREKRSEK